MLLADDDREDDEDGEDDEDDPTVSRQVAMISC